LTASSNRRILQLWAITRGLVIGTHLTPHGNESYVRSV
jgi:hypothetical protein